MDKISSLMKKDKIGEIILITIFILYLIFGFRTPSTIAKQVNTIWGKCIIILIVVGMFIYTGPLLAILSLLVGFELIRRSKNSYKNNNNNSNNYIPCENSTNSQFSPHHQFSFTLEQEVVNKMAPIKNSGTSLTKPSYKPVLENFHDASPVNNNSK